MNGKRLAIGGDLSAAELRRLARREPDRAAAACMQAIAGALEGMERQHPRQLLHSQTRFVATHHACPTSPQRGHFAPSGQRARSSHVRADSSSGKRAWNSLGVMRSGAGIVRADYMVVMPALTG
jgi:hypothetical protein